MAHQGGRPSKYSNEMLTKAHEYLQQCVDEELEFHKTRGDKTNTYERKLKVNLPSVEGLSIYLGVSRDTLYEWSKEHQEFSDTLDEVLKLQKKVLIEKGLSGDYNPLISKLVLSANHGMRDKTDVTSDGERLTINVIKFDGDNDTA